MHNYRPALISLVTLLLGHSASGQAPPTQPATPPTLPARPALAAPSFTVERSRTRVRFENDGTSRRDLSVRLKLRDEQAVRQWGQIQLTYQPDTEELTLGEFQVLKPDGSVGSSAAGNVQDLAVKPFDQLPIYLDIRQKLITASALRPGDVLQFSATWTVKQPLTPGQFWFQHSFDTTSDVLQEQLEIDLPATRTITLKSRPGGPVEQAGGNGTVEGDRRIWRWTSAHAASPAAKDDDEPTDDEPIRPDVALTSYRNWDEVARWFNSLMSAPVSAAVRSKAAELTKGLTDPSKKIDAIYDYVSSEVRYISLSFGVGRFAPHAPDEVLRNQYGDCKDKSALLAALLGAIDVKAAQVLLHTNRSVAEDLPSPLEFDHVVTVLARGEGPAAWLWMDSTAEVAPPGMLNAAIRDKLALFVGDEKNSSRLVRTPADPSSSVVDRIDLEGTVNSIGVLVARAKFTVTGDLALTLRALARSLPRENLEELAKTLAAGNGIAGDVSDFSTSDPLKTREPFEVTLQVRASNYLNWAAEKSELKVAPTVIFPFAKESARRGKSKVEFGSPKRLEMHTAIELPAGYAADAPVPVSVSKAGIAYSSTYTATGRQVRADRKLVVTARAVPAAQFGEYSAFVGAAEADFAQHFTIRGSVTSTPVIPPDATAYELYAAAFNAFKSKNYLSAVALWKRNTEVDPKMGDAWGSLGLTYHELKQFDDAVDAFRHQTTVDPYDERAYSDLGRTLKAAGKLDEAAQAYAKHVEITPLDGSALRELGKIYVDLGRDPDAVSALERAAAIEKGGDAWLFIDLGSAQLRSKQRDKALKAYERALAISPTPAVWTKIAWDLAEAGEDLDQAAALSARSEKAIIESTQKLDLKTIRSADLDLMARLAWTWDAAGWVQFQKGNTARAESYVDAAWLLNTEAETAFHLGRIYEKDQTRQADALNLYLQAEANGERPVKEVQAAVTRMAKGADTKPLVDAARRVTVTERAVQLKSAPKKVPAGEADFLVMVGDDNLATDVRFLYGDEAMRALEPALLEPGYPVSSPSRSGVRLILGVGVKCLQDKGCFAVVKPARLLSLSPPDLAPR